MKTGWPRPRTVGRSLGVCIAQGRRTMNRYSIQARLTVLVAALI